MKNNIISIIEKKIKETVSDNEYDKYFKGLSFAQSSKDSNLFQCHTHNVFILKWVKTKYDDFLQEIINTEMGGGVKIEYSNTKIEKQSSNQKTTQPTAGTPRITNSSILNPSFIFDSFVVGSSNTFAFASAKNTVKNPGRVYNPLFIHGGVGLGKTHLLQAIGNEAVSRGFNVIYLSTEQLMNDFTKHITNQSMEQFKKKYRTCDILLIDDVQFLSKKEIFQEEFFHTFNELHEQKKQIVLTSDQKPSEIIGLEERLKSRFEWGLVTSIAAPDLETKIGIIKKKCEIDGISLTNDIIVYIATQLETNIREIEGILIKLNAYANLINLDEINIEFAKNILKEHIKEKKEVIHIDDVIAVASRELNIKPSEIKSKHRGRAITHARRIVIYLARELTRNSMPYIAKYFNMKDHSAVSHSIRKMTTLLKEDENEVALVNSIKNKILTPTQ